MERFHCSVYTGDYGYKGMIGMDYKFCMLLLGCVPRVYDMRKRSEVGTLLLHSGKDLHIVAGGF